MTTRSHWPLWLWLMDGVVVLVVAVAALGGLFMPALLLDIASFWPLYLVGMLAGGILAIFPPPARPEGVAQRAGGGQRRSRGRARDWLRLVPPLFVAMGLALVVGLHFWGWGQLPSAAGDLHGPAVGSVRNADVAVAMSGMLSVGSGGALLYEVELAKSGGSTGVPESLESITETEAIVTMRETRDSFWFETSGWHLQLAVEPAWAVDVRSPVLDADLRGLQIRTARLDGSGTAALPTTNGIVEIAVSGGFVLSVAAGQPVEVVGTATVPDGWVATEDGWRSPTDGEGLVILVDSGAVEVVER